MPAAPWEPLAIVRPQGSAGPVECSLGRPACGDEHSLGGTETGSTGDNERFGDNIQKKDKHTLRIGFQNIGGLPGEAGRLKDDLLQKGISTWDFDIFGLAETNVDWRLPQEDDQLFFRSRFWWDSLSLSYAHNKTAPSTTLRQYGGVALFGINQVAHRVASKGADPSGLGRWTWLRFQGRQRHNLRIISAYRPNDSKGPLSVFAQHKLYLNGKDDDRCPRLAFVEDLCKDIESFMEAGDHIVLMLDGNEDMRKGALKQGLQSLHLTECILARHGTNAPNTYRRNTKNVPIDGIWTSSCISIKAGGFFAFDEVFSGTDHRCIWIDISFEQAFGHNLAPITRPQARRLQCKDPRLVDNYIRHYEKFLTNHQLPQRASALESQSTFPLDPTLQREFEEIDKLRYQGMEEAERKCRKLKMGQVAFSPALQYANRQIRAWSLLLKKRKGLKVSSRLLQRSLKKAGLDMQNRSMELSYLEDQLKQAHQYYYSVKSNHESLRESALDSLADAVAQKEGLEKSTVIKTLKLREAQRRVARKIKYIRGKLAIGNTTMVTIQTPSGDSLDIVDKVAIEEAIMKENKAKFQQSFHTPFLRPPLITDVGLLGTGPSASAILGGTYKPHPDLSPFTQEYLAHLAFPERQRNTNPEMAYIKVDDYRSFWKKARENTSSYPGAVNFSTLKAGAQGEISAEFDCRMTRLPLISGFSPNRWRKCIDVMILKKAGVTTLSSLRTIVLFAADCNYAFKHIGRAMMKQAERQQSIAPEQFGSRKAHRAIDQALNKVLANDLMRQMKLPGAICSNDAKSCYDLIVHAPASLSMQRQGVPQCAVVCLFGTLQNLSHQIRTAYGDSDNHYGGPYWIIPMHGIGQGNGAGPAIWAVVSTPLLNMLRASGVGSYFVSPISRKEIRFVGYAFVDDTDLIQTARPNSSSSLDVAQELQRALDVWEGGLHASGGAIVPEKSHWYLVQFQWTGGEWKYSSVANSPATLQVKDISGELKTLQRLEPWEAATSLGVDIAADGNQESQFRRMRDASIKWADQIRTGRLLRAEVHTALHSTLWKTLGYPLPCTSLSRRQCEDIMAPALRQALPAMGICRNFPRTVVHSPLSRMGLAVPHLHSLQEIARIKAIIHHTATNTFTGQLFRGSLEALLLEVGIGEDLLQFPFPDLQALATPSLIKSTWETLSTYNLRLSHDVVILSPRENDALLTRLFYGAGARGDALRQLNQCRLYIQALHVSDIADFAGEYITEAAWRGDPPLRPVNAFNWPKQGKPSSAAWATWRQFLSQHMISRHRRLKKELGVWTITDDWPWFLDPVEGRLYERRTDGWWYYLRIPIRTRRLQYTEGGKGDPPQLLHKAYVLKVGQRWICSSHGPDARFLRKSSNRPLSVTPGGSLCLTEHIASLPLPVRWSIMHHRLTDTGEIVAEALREGCAIAVCDGSYKDNKGSAAWVIEGRDSIGRMTGYNFPPGPGSAQNSYRSELAGIFGILTMLEAICTVFHISAGRVVIACDNITALNHSFVWDHWPPIDAAERDLVFAIRKLVAKLPIQCASHHVKGHQDEQQPVSALDRWSILNIEMDKMAKRALLHWEDNASHQVIEGEPWAIWINNNKIINNLDTVLYDALQCSSVEDYWVSKNKFPSHHAANIHWEAIGHAMRSVPLARRTFITKHASGMCGVGKFMKRWKERETDACPRCGSFEDAQHVWICQDLAAGEVWNNSLDKLDLWLIEVGTLPDIRKAIISKLTLWRSQGTGGGAPEPEQSGFSSPMQEECGWQSLLEGFITCDWATTQQLYYRSIRSLKTGRRWAIALIKKLWEVAWDQWEHRNAVLHDSDNLVTREEDERLNFEVSVAYSTYRLSLPRTCLFFFQLPLQVLLRRSDAVKRAWLVQIQAAKEREIRRRLNRWGAEDNERNRRSLSNMQRSMRQWLRISR